MFLTEWDAGSQLETIVGNDYRNKSGWDRFKWELGAEELLLIQFSMSPCRRLVLNFERLCGDSRKVVLRDESSQGMGTVSSWSPRGCLYPSGMVPHENCW
mgnify:CR=1 FL=1